MENNKTYDKKGREIFPGDLIKVFHFTDYKNRKRYMYKLVVEIDGTLYGNHLNLNTHRSPDIYSGVFKLPYGKVEDFEIVQGHGGVYMGEDFLSRKRIK